MESVMKVGSLFSGGGLGDFGFMAAGMEISWQCEIDEYCQKILALRYPESKKYIDIKTLKGADLEPVDILTGGFPCQPFSVAGKRKGKDDNRYLWPEMLRIIKECRPRWVIGENVVGITNLALDTVCADLEAEGYEVWPVVFPSHALGAKHKRDRMWIISYNKSVGTQRRLCQPRTSRDEPREDGQRRDVADATSNAEGSAQRQKINGGRTNNKQNNGNVFWGDLGDGSETFRRFWELEPTVGRVAHGVADRVHRLKMLGNGQCPVNTFLIGKFILEVEREYESKKM